jgi:hypothetical protein
MTLVGVEHLRRRRTGHGAVRPDRAHSPDAQQQLLLEPVIDTAAVETVGHLAQRGVVLLEIGVEHQQRHTAHPCHPDLCVQRATVREVELQAHRVVRLVQQRRDRQALRVEVRVVLQLPAVRRERLAEVARAVQQADADDRHAQVGRRLEVVASEDA